MLFVLDLDEVEQVVYDVSRHEVAIWKTDEIDDLEFADSDEVDEVEVRLIRVLFDERQPIDDEMVEISVVSESQRLVIDDDEVVVVDIVDDEMVVNELSL